MPRFAQGGLVGGTGTATSDSNTVALSRGEYVVNAKAVDMLGLDNLNAINQGKLPGRSVQLNQNNNIYSQFDLTAANQQLYWQLRTGAATA